MNRCDWAACSNGADVFCGQWWHCHDHYEQHLEFEREKQRPAMTLVKPPPVPKQRGSRPITNHSPLAAYKRAWMANKRAALRAERERASA